MMRAADKMQTVLCNFNDSVTFPYHASTDPGSDRSVFGFTLRDSPMDFINASCWGSCEHVMGISKKFCIGDSGMQYACMHHMNKFKTLLLSRS